MSHMALKCDVAIVGGGIGGLTLAIGLRQELMSVQVFEQDADLREIGAGIAIGGNATRLLERLGGRLGTGRQRAAGGRVPALERW